MDKIIKNRLWEDEINIIKNRLWEHVIKTLNELRQEN